MPDQFRAGDRVLVGHAFGSGSVIRETEDGVLVRLDSGTVIEWQKSDTHLIDAPAAGSPSSPEEAVASRDAGPSDEYTDDQEEVASFQGADTDGSDAPQRSDTPDPSGSSDHSAGSEVTVAATTIATAQHARPAAKRRGCRDSMRAIDALRFGVVPATRTAEITLGYETFKSWVLGNLPQPPGHHPMVSEVAGPFGTGKSHAMATVRQVAREAGYLTASVEVDGESVSLSQPKELLSALLPTLGGDSLDSHAPAVEMTSAALKARDGWITPELRRCTRVASNTTALRELQQFGRWEEHEAITERLLTSDHTLTVAEYKKEIVHGEVGVGNSIYYSGDFDPMPLVGHRVIERADDFAKALLGYALLAWDAGHKGLVVTIDEFEIEHLTRARWNRVVDLINALAEHVDPETSIVSAPLAIFIATVGEEGHVGDAVVEVLVDGTPGDRFVLQEWSEEDRLVLAERIHTLYRDAYPDIDETFDPQLVAMVEDELEESEVDSSGLIRAFIKRYVLALDKRYGPSQAA